ncbi:MAG: flagellar hook-basal body complex protein FliE [Thermoanaerobacteraceae bacterium]|nr:flagellar hook-basal body complex protein FliE [Thermoanaerobacteraceae bacterium]
MIDPISLINGTRVSAPQNTSSDGKSFADILNGAIDQVNKLQDDALKNDVLLSTGNVSQLHDVMLASVKADLALELTIAIRNKALEAYQEIMRMQV